MILLCHGSSTCRSSQCSLALLAWTALALTFTIQAKNPTVWRTFHLQGYCLLKTNNFSTITHGYLGCIYGCIASSVEGKQHVPVPPFPRIRAKATFRNGYWKRVNSLMEALSSGRQYSMTVLTSLQVRCRELLCSGLILHLASINPCGGWRPRQACWRFAQSCATSLVIWRPIAILSCLFLSCANPTWLEGCDNSGYNTFLMQTTERTSQQINAFASTCV